MIRSRHNTRPVFHCVDRRLPRCIVSLCCPSLRSRLFPRACARKSTPPLLSSSSRVRRLRLLLSPSLSLPPRSSSRTRTALATPDAHARTRTSTAAAAALMSQLKHGNNTATFTSQCERKQQPHRKRTKSQEGATRAELARTACDDAALTHCRSLCALALQTSVVKNVSAKQKLEKTAETKSKRSHWTTPTIRVRTHARTLPHTASRAGACRCGRRTLDCGLTG